MRRRRGRHLAEPSPALQVEYGGHVIRYDDINDVWTVEGLAYKNAKLSLCKARVDKFGLELRRLNNVRVLTMGWDGEHEETEATSIDADEKSLYIVRRSGNKTERGKVDLKSTVLDTPENRAALQNVRELRNQSNALERKARAALEAIPRVTIAQLRGAGMEYDL